MSNVSNSFNSNVETAAVIATSFAKVADSIGLPIKAFYHLTNGEGLGELRKMLEQLKSIYLKAKTGDLPVWATVDCRDVDGFIKDAAYLGFGFPENVLNYVSYKVEINEPMDLVLLSPRDVGLEGMNLTYLEFINQVKNNTGLSCVPANLGLSLIANDKWGVEVETNVDSYEPYAYFAMVPVRREGFGIHRWSVFAVDDFNVNGSKRVYICHKKTTNKIADDMKFIFVKPNQKKVNMKILEECIHDWHHVPSRQRNRKLAEPIIQRLYADELGGQLDIGPNDPDYAVLGEVSNYQLVVTSPNELGMTGKYHFTLREIYEAARESEFKLQPCPLRIILSMASRYSWPMGTDPQDRDRNIALFATPPIEGSKKPNDYGPYLFSVIGDECGNLKLCRICIGEKSTIGINTKMIFVQPTAKAIRRNKEVMAEVQELLKASKNDKK